MVVAALLAGCTYSNFETMTLAIGLPGIHANTFDGYIDYFAPIVSHLAKESLALVRYLIVRYGKCVDALICTTDE